jgi:ABC-type glycerol-3-phosphate transport system substrate-binding protein
VDAPHVTQGSEATTAIADSTLSTESYPAAPDVQTLTIARVENNRYINEAISAFNELGTEQTLESIWYNDNEGDLKLSLVSGDGPDLISLDGFEYETYASKGVFVDLYTFLDADPELDKNDLVLPVLEAMEWTNHELYQISPTYYVQSMYVSPDVWDSDVPWTIDNIALWMDENPDSAFTNAVETPAELLRVLLLGYLPSFIDYTNMDCTFTSDKFVSILEDAKAWAARDWKDSIYEENAFENGSILCGWSQINSFDGYKELSDQGLTNSVGFLSDTDSCVFAGSVIRFAICNGTENENSAWEFIKATLSEEYQENVPWLPMLRSELDARAKRALQETPASVTQVYADPSNAALGTNVGMATVTIPPVDGLTQAEVDDLISLIESVSSFSGNSNVDIWEIIFDEVNAYFSDQKSASEVAEIIQNRASIYLSEHN